MQTVASSTHKQHSKRKILFKKSVSYGGDFIAKFNNDWVMNLASGLAYSLLTAIVPIAIAVVAVLGFTVGNLDPQAEAELIDHLRHIFPASVSSTTILQLALDSLKRNAGLLSILATITAIFGGSRLFITIEGYFAIIYRTYTRNVIKQNMMAIAMMCVFIALVPIMILASSLPALILSLVQNSGLNQLPGIIELSHNGFIIGAAGILGSLIVCWILLEVIYIAVPNQRIHFKNSWRGAVVGALLAQFFLSLFPLYITHFMGSYTGEVGFAVILLLFFYYFAVILLLGAEINAYTAEKVKPLANNVAAVLYDASQPIEVNERQKQASADKKAQETRPDNKETVDKLESNEPEMTNNGKFEASDIAEVKEYSDFTRMT